MAFASGAVSLRRYFLSGRIPKHIDDKFVAAVSQRAFGATGVAGDGTQFGWLGPRHLFDTDIQAEHIAFGRFAHFALRIDRHDPPAALVRSYARLEEETLMQASGREFLSAKERRKAREAARDRAEKESRSGAFRRMSAYSVLLDVERRTLCFGSLAAGANDKLVDLLADTFGCTVESAGPQQIALRLLAPAGQERKIENLEPFHLVRPPEESEAAPFADGDQSFLGREFLTWLWFKTDTPRAGLRIARGDEVAVMIARTLRLDCDFAQSGSDVILCDGPAASPEARAALAIGKQPTKAGLIVGGAAGEFACVLDGPRMAVSGLVLPEDTSERDPRVRLETRFEQIFDACELLDMVFDLFLRERAGAEWNTTLQAMRVWAAGRPEGPRRAVSA